MNNTLDYRSYARKLELRNVSKTGYLPKGLQGYAVVYGTESRDMGGFREVIVEGAMRDSLGKKMDVRMLNQHDTAQPIARESAGNLVLREDKQGVYFEADLLDIQLNRDVLAQVEARNLDAMSFGMPRDSMKVRFEGPTKERSYGLRNVLRADFVEISVVTWAAYEETTVMARCAEEYKTFMQQDAAAKLVPVGILRARHALAKSKYRY